MKKSKKFVLAVLALLAITGLLALAGCKNDTVPETPKYTVTFNTDGGSTVASQTVESGQKAKEPPEPELEGSWFLGWYSDEGLAKKFDFNTQITTATTVYAKWSYKLHTKPTTLTNYTSSHAPEGEWTYVEFGDWPQNILKGDVKVDETKSKEMGMFTYYLGDDGNHYVKAEEKAYEAGYKYSDGSDVNQKDESSSPSTRWFKVEPIKWRVLNKDSASTGKVLLLAESILTGGIPYYHFDSLEGGLEGEEWSGHRIIEGKTILLNNYEHSQIRAWLNGLSYQSKEREGATQSPKDEYKNAGFLQTAFTESAQKLIADTSVDNSAASTTDKIFLLSQQEATNSEYGFAASSEEDSTRIRVTTDYAKATGAYQGDSTEGYSGWWWLRSPLGGYADFARVVFIDGNALQGGVVYNTHGGVVPALSISLK